MKHLNKFNESNEDTKSSGKNLKLDMKHVKIYKPTENDIESVVNIIKDYFPGSKILEVRDGIIIAKQGDQIRKGSCLDWAMGITDLLSKDGEEIMRLFFWQNNNPIQDELVYIIEDAESFIGSGEEEEDGYFREEGE